MVRGKGEENAQGRHDLGQYLMLVVGYLRFQALANLTRPIMVQFSHTYIMGTTGALSAGALQVVVCGIAL